MFKNRLLKWIIKALCAFVSFVIILLVLQPVLIPKFFDDSTTRVHGYSYLPKNSIDVLFLGASQMFCSVDAGRLTDEYGISSYDFGANSQVPCTTSYYFDEALKTQSPKLVMFEIAMIYNNDSATDDALAWNYSQMPTSLEKYNSLYNLLDRDFIESFDYTFLPLAKYHDRWKSVDRADVGYVINPQKYINLKPRGFSNRDHIEKQEIAFNGEKDGEERVISPKSIESIKHISSVCKKKNIKLVFFKAPSAFWTRTDSQKVKQFMNDNDYQYIDLNDSLNKIGIDDNRDFYDSSHMNCYGAEKVTNYLVPIITKYLND